MIRWHRDACPVLAHSRLGLRCEALILLGFIWALMGAGVEMGASRPPDGLLFLLIPKACRAAAWIGTGTFAVVAAVRSSRTDTALGLLTIMPLMRLVSYLLAWVLWLHPGVDPGEYPDGWYQAGYYAAMCGFAFYVAHIPSGLMRARNSPDADRETERRAALKAEHVAGIPGDGEGSA